MQYFPYFRQLIFNLLLRIFQYKIIGMIPAYNSSSYYRSNPYSREGYIPPMGHKNRHKQQFFSEIPTGQQYYDNSGKKHYRSIGYKSQIQENHLMSSPQKYSYENIIATDKNYSRALNTIDIEGTAPGTIVSQAVRNKLKAQEELMRRKKQQFQAQQAAYNHNLQRTAIQQQRQNSNTNKTNYQRSSSFFAKSDDQNRRQFAMRQLQKNQELADLLSRKNYHSKITQNKMPNQLLNHAPQQNNDQSVNLKTYHSQYLQKNNDNYNLIKKQQNIYTKKDVNKEGVNKEGEYDYRNKYRNYKTDNQTVNNIREQNHQTNRYYPQYQTKIAQPYNMSIQYPHQRSKFFPKHMQQPYNASINYQRQGLKIAQPQMQQLYNSPARYPHQRSNFPPTQITRESYQNRYSTKRNQQEIMKANPENIFQKPVHQLKQMQQLNNQRLESSGENFGRGPEYGSRQIHRKMNPTYLSFASPTFGLAGKNTLGY